MTGASLSLLYTTTDSADHARTMARSLVEENLAACVNITGPLTSCYRWQGHTEEAVEYGLLVKTPSDRLEEARERLLALHSYTTPCVLVWPCGDVHPPFMHWAVEQTRPPEA
jgi:periplasmic divalent cation tolerance protein